MCEFFFTAHIYAFSIGTPQQHQISKTKHLPIFFFHIFCQFPQQTFVLHEFTNDVYITIPHQRTR